MPMEVRITNHSNKILETVDSITKQAVQVAMSDASMSKLLRKSIRKKNRQTSIKKSKASKRRLRTKGNFFNVR